MDLQIANKTALVTGASTGIGRGIAKALAAEGVHVAIAARRTSLLHELAAEIVADGGQSPVVIACDLLTALLAYFVLKPMRKRYLASV